MMKNPNKKKSNKKGYNCEMFAWIIHIIYEFHEEWDVNSQKLSSPFSRTKKQTRTIWKTA